MDEQFRELMMDGYKVRPARYDDLPQAVPMFNAAERELIGAGDITVERYIEEWRQTGIDLDTSTRIVFSPQGNVVGCVELWDHFNPPARPWIWGRVHPAWEGRGIGHAMLTWALDTSLRALDRLPEDARLAPHVAAPSRHHPSIELFEGAGMKLQRYSWRMVRELDEEIPPPQWPERTQVRTLKYPQDLETVYRLQEEAFQEHWGHIERPFDEAFPQWKDFVFKAQGLKPDLWFLAIRDGQIIGFINSHEQYDMDENMGWIYTLAVLKPYRKQGLGQALLLQAFQALQTRAVRRVGLAVDSRNKTGATRLYERVGMRIQHEMAHYETELRPGRELAVMD